MGSEGFYPEERPIQGVEVDGFWMDEHPVTAGEFRRFVRETGSWVGKELPTEAEREYAARGGLEGAVFSWGEEEYPDGRPMANTWQGQFPWENLRLDGHEGTSPVGSFPPNGYGLYDMCGNVWEWTTDPFMSGHAEKPCCAPRVLPGERFARTSTSHIGFRCVVREPPPQ
jgi:formylglycine-generating enzyme